MKTSNFRLIERQINMRINNALKREVASQVKKTMAKVIDVVVYARYQPYNRDGGSFHYHRTYQLKEKKNIKAYIKNPAQLYVRNVYRGVQNVDVPKIIETGKEYDWGYQTNPNWRNLDREIGARPFHQQTAEQLRVSRKHVEALRRGLHRQGIKTF